MDALKMNESLQYETIERILREFIAENFIVADIAETGEDESLLEKGIIDSTGVLELVAFLESRFGIKVEDEELIPENLDTIANIKAYTYEKMNTGLTGRKGSMRGAAPAIS